MTDDLIFTTLGPLVASRCYPIVFPQKPLPVWPAIRFTRVGGTIYPDACGAGDDSTDDQRFQVDIVATTLDELTDTVTGLVPLARAAMALLTVPTVLQAPPAFEYDPETKTYRAVMDFICYGSSPP